MVDLLPGLRASEETKNKGGRKMDNIDMIPVSSSNVAEVGYEEQSQIVYVRFLNGSLYAYKGVPEHEFNELLNAPSVGSYLHKNYKNFYPYERIE